MLGTVYKLQEGECSSVFKSDQPGIWTPLYSLFYIKMYRIVYRAVYSTNSVQYIYVERFYAVKCLRWQ